MENSLTSITVEAKTLNKLNQLKYKIMAKNLNNTIEYLLTYHELNKKEKQNGKKKR